MHPPVFARTDYEGPALTKLVDIINYVKPTALLGLSTLKVSAPTTPSYVSAESVVERLHGRGCESHGSHQRTSHHVPSLEPCSSQRG